MTKEAQQVMGDFVARLKNIEDTMELMTKHVGGLETRFNDRFGKPPRSCKKCGRTQHTVRSAHCDYGCGPTVMAS